MKESKEEASIRHLQAERFIWVVAHSDDFRAALKRMLKDIEPSETYNIAADDKLIPLSEQFKDFNYIGFLRDARLVQDVAGYINDAFVLQTARDKIKKKS